MFGSVALLARFLGGHLSVTREEEGEGAGVEMEREGKKGKRGGEEGDGDGGTKAILVSLREDIQALKADAPGSVKSVKEIFKKIGSKFERNTILGERVHYYGSTVCTNRCRSFSDLFSKRYI